MSESSKLGIKLRPEIKGAFSPRHQVSKTTVFETCGRHKFRCPQAACGHARFPPTPSIWTGCVAAAGQRPTRKRSGSEACGSSRCSPRPSRGMVGDGSGCAASSMCTSRRCWWRQGRTGSVGSKRSAGDAGACPARQWPFQGPHPPRLVTAPVPHEGSEHDPQTPRLTTLSAATPLVQDAGPFLRRRRGEATRVSGNPRYRAEWGEAHARPLASVSQSQRSALRADPQTRR
jgi:hypothetical protein